MKFSVTLTFNPLEHLVPLAIAADEMGYHSVNIGDGLFYYDETSTDYPYTDSGARYWSAKTPFADPLALISAMGQVTRSVRFLVNVLKLPVRQPLLVAKQCGTVSYLTQDRLSLGVGLSPWPEDFTVNSEDWHTRGARCSEMIEIIRKVLSGDMVEHKGEYYEFPSLSINPVPAKPMPIVIGGTATPVLKRAARIADGFVSPNVTTEEIGKMISEINGYRAEYGRERELFEFISTAIDAYDLDTHKRLQDIGVTEACVMPWMFYGGKFKSDMELKVDSMKKCMDEVATKLS